jgi:hypothetical protein
MPAAQCQKPCSESQPGGGFRNSGGVEGGNTLVKSICDSTRSNNDAQVQVERSGRQRGCGRHPGIQLRLVKRRPDSVGTGGSCGAGEANQKPAAVVKTEEPSKARCDRNGRAVERVAEIKKREAKPPSTEIRRHGVAVRLEVKSPRFAWPRELATLGPR